MRMTALVVISAIALGAAACGKKDEPAKTTTAPPPYNAPSTPPPAAGVAASSVTVGNAIGADRRIVGAPATISPKDTFYVSVDTTGSGAAKLKARWTYLKGGTSQMVREIEQQVSTTGPATHEFHISKPDGWPKGEYQVEVFVNDAPAGTRRFTVT